MARHFRADIAAVLERWGADCYVCGELVALDVTDGPQAPNVGHVIPLALGGSSDLLNLRLVHQACNMRQAARLICPHCHAVLT